MFSCDYDQTYQKLLKHIKSNISNQPISAHFENIFSKQQTGFRRGLNAQQCLLVVLEKFRKVFHKGWDYNVLLTDLSKYFTAYLMI